MAQDLCSDILKWGIWSTSYRYDEKEFAEKTMEFFQNNKTYSKKATIDAAAKAGITLPVEGLMIPMNLDGTFGSNKSENYSDAIIYQFQNEVLFKSKYIEVNTQADAGIVQAWMRCQELRYSNDLVMSATPIYSRIIESDTEDQITIEITANVLGEDFGRIEIDRERFIESLQINGCRLLQSIIDPLRDGRNSILIARSSDYRRREGFIQIRTNRPSYQCNIRLKQEFEENMPTLSREIGTDLEKEFVRNLERTNEFSLTVSNDKDKDVILRIEAQIDIYGSNESADLYLFAGREEGLVQLNQMRIPNWSNWLRQPLYYEADIPFYKNSPITIKAGFGNWTGGAIDLNTTNIRITCKY